MRSKPEISISSERHFTSDGAIFMEYTVISAVINEADGETDLGRIAFENPEDLCMLHRILGSYIRDYGLDDELSES